MDKKDTGLAFPNTGLTKREYFTIEIMKSLIIKEETTGHSLVEYSDYLIGIAIKLADRMLESLEK